MGRRAVDTVADAILSVAERAPDNVFVTFQGEKRTYKETFLRAESVARGLKSIGIRRGDRVALFLPNCLEFIDVWFASALLGSVIVPINPELKGESLRFIIEHARISAIILPAGVVRTLLEPIWSKGLSPYIITIGEMEQRYLEGTIMMEWKNLLHVGGTLQRVKINPEDVLGILYTSGTTGLPKGVKLPHYCYCNTGSEIVRHLGIDSSDIWMTTLPLFHCNAQQFTVMGTLMGGGSVSLEPRFSARRFWQAAVKSEVTVASFIGSLLYMLLSQPAGPYDTSHQIRFMVGGPAPKNIFHAFEERFHVRLVEGYGLTETATVCLLNPRDVPRPGSCGKPLSYTEVQVVDDQDQPVSPGSPGEIVTRANHPLAFCSGYFRNEDATANLFRNGWLRTGDLGTVDQDGYFYFLDRLKDCIRRRGENISSQQLEHLLSGYAGIMEVAAYGIPCELGEEDVAVAVVADIEKFNVAKFAQWCRETLPGYMVPRFIRVISSLPKTPTHRVKKNLLREQGVSDSWDRTLHADFK